MANTFAEKNKIVLSQYLSAAVITRTHHMEAEEATTGLKSGKLHLLEELQSPFTWFKGTSQ